MFKLEIETGNAAFDRGPDREVAAMLRRLADRLESGETSGGLMDSNGNRVGSFSLEHPEKLT